MTDTSSTILDDSDLTELLKLATAAPAPEPEPDWLLLEKLHLNDVAQASNEAQAAPSRTQAAECRKQAGAAIDPKKAFYAAAYNAMPKIIATIQQNTNRAKEAEAAAKIWQEDFLAENALGIEFHIKIEQGEARLIEVEKKHDLLVKNARAAIKALESAILEPLSTTTPVESNLWSAEQRKIDGKWIASKSGDRKSPISCIDQSSAETTAKTLNNCEALRALRHSTASASEELASKKSRALYIIEQARFVIDTQPVFYAPAEDIAELIEAEIDDACLSPITDLSKKIEILRLQNTLARLAALTPNAANSASALDLHRTIKAIAESALCDHPASEHSPAEDNPKPGSTVQSALASTVVSDLDELLEAIQNVLIYRVGELPNRGYLVDNDMSRAAIAKLVDIITKTNQKLSSRETRLRDTLQEASRQITYLHEKFKETGSGMATLARIESVLESTNS